MTLSDSNCIIAEKHAQEDIKKHPETVSSPISTEEFIEFLRDTEPEWHKDTGTGFILRPLEVHEVPAYA